MLLQQQLCLLDAPRQAVSGGDDVSDGHQVDDGAIVFDEYVVEFLYKNNTTHFKIRNYDSLKNA